MIHRIELYIDNPERASFLREVEGDFNPAANDPFVTLAREYDETGRVTRAWFLYLDQLSDGYSPRAMPPHKIVSTKLVAGEPTPLNDPTATGSGGFGPEVLSKIKQLQIRQAEELQRTDRFCQTYRDALKRVDDWRSNVEHLNTVVAAKELQIAKLKDRIVALENENQSNRQSIAALRESYINLEKRKSLKEQFKAWSRRTIKRAGFK